jgi:hypothetical protein
MPTGGSNGSRGLNVSLDEHSLGGLRWIVVRGPDREAFRALGEHMRDEMAALIKTWGLAAKLREHVSGSPGRDRLASVCQASALGFPEAIPLADLAEGNPRRAGAWTSPA